MNAIVQWRPQLNTIYHMDALTLLRTLPDASVDMVLTDPPYFNLVSESWDRQWANRDDFLKWMDLLLAQCKRVLKSNGSLYVFASHSMQAHVEVLINKRFNILNNITWVKQDMTARRASPAMMRSYIPTHENLIFADMCSSDNDYDNALIDETQTYWDACQSLKKRIMGDYLQSEFDRANVNNREVAALFPSKSGNLTGCVSNWLLGHNMPTRSQYDSMRQYLNMRGKSDYLRRDYEDLRRPFYLELIEDNTMDVWYFTENNRTIRYHPTQKPQSLIEHILTVSTREGQTVLDPFMGSGTTAIAARNLNRNFIGCDITPEYVKIANDRLQRTDPYQATDLGNGMKQLSLFEGVSA